MNPKDPCGSTVPPRPTASAPARLCGLNVYLCGMIGSGKTVIGERLAVRLGRTFYDLDREMDRALGYSFHRLVQEQGWLAFRELEYDLCKRFAGIPAIVAALGGGTPRYAWNRDVLRGSGVTILLEADQKTLVDRVRQADRPRVNPGVSLEVDLERIWSTAGHLYRQAAGKEIDAEVEDLLALMAEWGISYPQPPW
jgi:shikimate kinase